MNEKDPISEWTNAIGSRFGSAAVVLILFAIVLCLIAPVFGPIIKQMKRKYYVMYEDYESRTEADMHPIRVFLWIIAIIGWLFVILCNYRYPL